MPSTEYHREWRNKNRERYTVKASAWAAANPDKVRAKMARHDAKPHRRAQRGDWRARQARYNERHPDRKQRSRREHQARRRKDPVQRAVDALRRRIRMTCYGVSRGALTGLGYSADQLRVHLEGLFKAGMTWANYGTWHVDHRRPVASFVLPDQMMECFALSNLQPLWAPENLKKGGRYAVANS
jgi:ribosomal protein L13E